MMTAKPAVAPGLIVVVGSLNMDLITRVSQVPEGGVTCYGHGFSTAPGGKGANQAVACARLGGRVAMVGRVGDDDMGKTLLSGLQREGIDTTHVLQTPGTASGVATILVEDSGQNRIILAPGANALLSAQDIDRAEALFSQAALIVVQLETPLETVEHVLRRAQAAKVPVLLNPAPAVPLPAAMLSNVDYLVPNESEAALLTGQGVSSVEDAKRAAQQLHAQGARTVLVTMGEKGVLVHHEQASHAFAAHTVRAVDTTAAGDTFIGGLCVGLVQGWHLEKAVALAQAASALCVTRAGAQPSIPYRRELPDF